MNKSILIKAGIILGIFVAIIVASVGCSLINTDPDVAVLTNGDDIYLTTDDFTVTNQELYETMVKVDGLSHLLTYIDEILLADYIAEVTQDEIDKELLLLIFGTDNEDVLNELQTIGGLYDEYFQAFYDNLEILGYDASDDESVAEYLRLSVAKKNLTKAKIIASEYGSIFYVYDNEVEAYYDTTVKNDVYALELRFSSQAEADAVFLEFNLVLNYNEGIGEYFGAVDIGNVSSEEFDETNTNQLTDEEVFAYFVAIYNNQNPYETQLALDVTQEELSTNHSDISLFNLEEMTTGLNLGSIYAYYSNYLFNTLDLNDEDVVRYSYDAREFGDEFIFVYKISQENVAPFLTIPAAEQDVYYGEYVDMNLTDDLIRLAMDELRMENDFDIVEPFLALSYTFQTGVEMGGEGSTSVIAVLGDLEITADDLFEFMDEQVGVFYSLEVVKIKMILTSTVYTDLYGTNVDYLKDNKGDLEAFRDNLTSIKSQFNNGVYASSGFSNTVYSWSELLYLGFGVKTEADVIEQDVLMSLQPDLINPTIDFASYSDYLQLQVDEYFSLNATHILLYVDFDNNFMPDDFSDFIEEIESDPATSLEYYTLKALFETIVNDKLNDDMSFTEIVEEYNETLVNDDESVWYELKQYGFKLLTEVLSANGSLNYLNSGDLDEAFQVALKELYDTYTNPVNVDSDHLLASALTTTDFGVHLIDATKGEFFELPSAMYIPDGDNLISYSEGSENGTDVPNESQLALYNALLLAEDKGLASDILIPGTVLTAIESYYFGIRYAYFNQTGYSIVAGEYLLGINPVFTNDSVTKLAKVDTIIGILYTVNFPEEFVRPTN
ncbi:MAG: hypothetical protein QM489_04625 [Candidatus Izemoplasma sp.]